MSIDTAPSRANAGTARPVLVVVTAVATWWTPLQAQTPDTLRQDTVYELEPIAVRAVRPTATSGGVSAIEVRMDSVRFQAAPLLEQVLRELPLVQVRTNSRGEAQLALRGAEERQIAILLDGIPLTLGWDHRTDLSVIPLTAAQQIQVLRGLASVLFGPNVLGGVVNISLGSVEGRVDPFRAAVGLDDTGGYAVGANAAAEWEVDDGRLVARAGVGYRDRESVPSPDVPSVYPALVGNERVNSYLTHTDGFGSVRYRAADGWVALSSSAFTAERGVPPELTDDGPRLWRYPEIWRSITVLAGGLDALYTPLGLATLDVSLGADVGGGFIEDYAMPAAPGDAAAEDFFATMAETEEWDDRTLTLRVRGTQQLDGGATLSAAGTYADVVHDEVVTVDLTTQPTAYPADYRQRLWSLGTEVDLPFDLDAGRFTGGRVSGGVALDGADTPDRGISDESGPSTTEWGGRLGVSASTTGGGFLLHAALSRKGRFPALREMYSEALGRFEPNPDLQPEILTVMEAGFTSRTGPYDLQLVGFHQRLDDAIVRGAPPPGSAARYQRVNRDGIHSTGVEILASYNTGRFAVETELTLQDVTVVSPGSDGIRAEYEPEFSGGIGGTLPLPMGFEGGAEIQYWGQQYCSTPEPGQDSYEVLDAGTRTDVQVARTFRLPGLPSMFRQVGLQLAVDNVTDAAIYDQCGLPQTGRALRIQLRID